MLRSPALINITSDNVCVCVLTHLFIEQCSDLCDCEVVNVVVMLPSCQWTLKQMRVCLWFTSDHTTHFSNWYDILV